VDRTSWINVGLGVWLAASAFALPHQSGTSVTEDVVTGLLVALAALWAAEAFKAAVSLVASWVVALGGLWIISAPFVLHYARSAAAVTNDVVVGLTITLFGLANTFAKARQLRR
jgi:di/tricarboxylate transporter